MTDTSPPARSSLADRLKHPTAVLVLGALVFAMLGFLAGAVATPGNRADQWRYGPGVHMNGYNGGFPGGMMGRGSYDGGFPGGMMGRGSYDDGFTGGMMGWGPNGGPDAQQRRVVRVDAGQVKSVSGGTVTLKNGDSTTKVKLTPNTYVVVHTLTPK